jgi:alpha-D-ribose 1-methylphosphonate 5-triphosphate synthase subunit PhnH
MNALAKPIPLAAGYDDPGLESQAAFRAMMDALARPGTPFPLESALTPPAPLSPVLAALALMVLDFEVTFWLSPAFAGQENVGHYLTFHSGAKRVEQPEAADFALVDLRADGLTLAQFNQGNAEYPDQSTTILALVEALDGGAAHTLTGPGIAGTCSLTIPNLPDDFVAQRAANRAQFPLGVDLVFVGGAKLIGLPRTTILAGGI